MDIVAVALAIACGPVHAADPAECRWAATPPVIDGRIDEAVWQKAQVVESFQSAWLPEGQRKPATATKARLLWDREYLYFSAEMEDTDLFADVTEQDATIWKCDVFELFFKPAKDKPGYYEFEINAANAKLDMFIPARGPDVYQRYKSDRDFHIDSAVQLRGTLNRRTDQDQGWTVEGRIPWRDFLASGGRPVPGEEWQHALCRYDYHQAWARPVLSSNAPLGTASFHRHEDYAPLKFIGPHGGASRARPAWDTSRLVGSPEPPPPFQTVPAFPKLQTKQPIMIAPEPGRNAFLLLEGNGYAPVREGRVIRLANDPGVSDGELLLEIAESIYDVCFHPKFAENGFLYLGANSRFGEGKWDFNSRVVRYTMDRTSSRIDPASRLVIIEWQSQGHNGGALTFGQDGMLYFTSGDGTSDSDEWDSGQDLTRLLAKLLRIDVDRPEAGRPYSIPKDNPFLQTADARPETWAYGFRNPWRMTMDRVTGDLWVGENGQDLWEYARIARRGENYGWPIVEGSHEFHQNRRRGPTPITKPLIEHSHTDFRSLTGGVVYRGGKFAELTGNYVYGDYSTGQIWAALHQDGKLLRKMCIADTTLGITGFCETPQGDILVIDHPGNAIHKLERAPAAAPRIPFPTKLSDTGLFADTTALRPQAGLIPYEVNAPAWHDGATSARQIALPPGGRMEVTERGGWNFPDGTAIVQTLTLRAKRVETRVMLRQESEWTGYTYAWNEAQTDAVLMGAAGETRQVAGQTWRIPGKQECLLCHSRQANFLLGVTTLQLNRGAQIADWERADILLSNRAAVDDEQWRRELGQKGLEGAALRAAIALVIPGEQQRQPPKSNPLLARAVETLPRLTDPQDSRASLNDRARAYLHANCSHCHAKNAGGNSLIQLGHGVAERNMAILNAVPQHATFGIEDAKIVTPGSSARSVLIHRTVLRGPGQMPPVGTMLADGAGATLLAQWIESLPRETIPPKVEKP